MFITNQQAIFIPKFKLYYIIFRMIIKIFNSQQLNYPMVLNKSANHSPNNTILVLCTLGFNIIHQYYS